MIIILLTKTLSRLKLTGFQPGLDRVFGVKFWLNERKRQRLTIAETLNFYKGLRWLWRYQADIV
ncbi:hypothetical protein D3Z47_21970 [Lachnospiraceae bacterium]|nr:hypothetical protein [Lachnospiraceae bacterium]